MSLSTPLFQRRAPILALAVGLTLAVAALTSQAESAASSASSLASDSIGSVSKSLESSSGSSGGRTATTRPLTGAYQVEGVQSATDRPGHVRVALAPASGSAPSSQPFQLVLPQGVQDHAALKAGQTIQVNTREYGYQFALAGQDQPFFLALSDEWLQKVKMQPVSAPAER